MFKKLFRSKARKESVEFIPDALMLETAGPGIPAFMVWVTILVLLVGGILWASLSKVDKIVAADGEIVTSWPVISMKPLERLVVSAIHVKQGDHVREGQVLFTFDLTSSKAELQRLEEQRASRRAHFERLRAELNGTDFVVRDPDSEYYRMQETLFKSRQEYYREKLNTYDENIQRLEGILYSLTESKKTYDERQKKLVAIENIYLELMEKQATSVKELLQTQVSVMGMAIQVDQLVMQIIEYQHQLLAMKAERNTFLMDWKRAVVEELVSVDRDLISVEQEIPKIEMLLNYGELRAPREAVVHEIAPFQVGSAVREAESLITLIPIGRDVNMEAEIKIHPKDLGRLRRGDTGRIKFDAYPFQQYGTLDGKLRDFSPTTFEHSAGEAARTPDGQSTYYKGWMVISGRFSGPDPDLPIIPGMKVRAEIRVGERTVISYLVYPFIKAMDESLREP